MGCSRDVAKFNQQVLTDNRILFHKSQRESVQFTYPFLARISSDNYDLAGRGEIPPVGGDLAPHPRGVFCLTSYWCVLSESPVVSDFSPLHFRLCDC